MHRCIAATLELNAWKVARYKIFPGEAKFRGQKIVSKKKIRWAIHRKKIQQIMDKAIPETTKEPPSSGWGYLTVCIF